MERVDASANIDLALVKCLIEQDCLSAIDATSYDGKCFLQVSITPKGAVVLAEWGVILRANSVKGQLIESVGKVVWLFAGVVATIAGSLILKVVE